MSTLEDALVSKARAVRRVRQQLALESALQILPVPRVRAIDPQEDEVHRLGERRAGVQLGGGAKRGLGVEELCLGVRLSVVCASWLWRFRRGHREVATG